MAADGRIVLGLVPFLALVLAAPAGCFFTPDPWDTSGGTGGTGGKASGTGGHGGGCTDNASCTDGNPCTDNICDKGVCRFPNNDKNVPSDTNPCTDDTCKDGVAVHTKAKAGTPCGMDLKCDDAGVCQCTNDAQCGMSTDCLVKSCDRDPVTGDAAGLVLEVERSLANHRLLLMEYVCHLVELPVGAGPNRWHEGVAWP